MARKNGSVKLDDVMYVKNPRSVMDELLRQKMPDVVDRMNTTEKKIESVEDWLKECTET